MRRPLPLLALATSVALVCACSTVDAPAGARDPAQALTVKGALSYRARIALPPDAHAIVTLKDVSRPEGPVVAEQRIDLAGRQVPIAFELAVDRSRLDPARRYAFRGAVFGGGRPLWASEPVMVDRPGAVVALGTLELEAVRARAVPTDFLCGTERALVDFTPQALRLKVGEATFEMRPTPTASGARYEAVGDPTTWLWSKGARATLAVKGKTYPECVQAAAVTTLRARGNEPGWRIDIEGDRMTLVTQDGDKRTLPTPAAQRTEAFTRYAARTERGDLTLTVFNRRCQDSMTGMPYPYAAELALGERKLAGCGGDPASLLQGREWVVTEIDGKGLVADARASLQFGADGRVAGRSSCNNFTAQYALSGEGLSVSKAASTMMACPPAVMEQEGRFLAALQSVRRFEIRPDGALVLLTDDRRSIVARR